MIEWWTPLHDATFVVIVASIAIVLLVKFGRWEERRNDMVGRCDRCGSFFFEDQAPGTLCDQCAQLESGDDE